MSTPIDLSALGGARDQLMAELDQEDELSRTLTERSMRTKPVEAVRRMYTPEELRLLPTIDSGQFSNLKIETPDYRVLLSRLTRADDYLGPPVEYVCRVGGAGDWVKCDSNGLPIPEPIEIVEIVGRRWFCGGPGKPGRTLCSAEIAVNGQPVARVLSNAGYGSMYEQAASRWLWLNGYIEPNEPLHQIAVDYPFRLVSSVVDVPRKMDL